MPLDPEGDALLAERVGEAMQVVLDALAPAERAAFVLHGADAVAGRFDGARGARPVSIDGDSGAAWIVRGAVKVVFAFHVEGGLVRDIEVIADPEILATLDVTRRRRAPR